MPSTMHHSHCASRDWHASHCLVTHTSINHSRAPGCAQASPNPACRAQPFQPSYSMGTNRLVVNTLTTTSSTARSTTPALHISNDMGTALASPLATMREDDA